MPSAKARKAAAAQRLNVWAAFHPHDAAQPAGANVSVRIACSI
jgi:hypothetical protein